MFGNKIMYTKSPGGIRRGLIYQNSDSGPTPIPDILMVWADSISGYRYQIGSNKMRKTLTLNTTYYTPKSGFTLDSNWYPVAMFKPVLFELNGTQLNEQTLDGYTSQSGKIKIKYENVTVKYNGHYLTERLVVVYYDITGVNVVNGTGALSQYQFYDILGDNLNNQFLDLFEVPGFKAFNSNNQLKISGSGKYDKVSSYVGPSYIDEYLPFDFEMESLFDIPLRTTPSPIPNNIRSTARIRGGQVDSIRAAAGNFILFNPGYPYNLSHYTGLYNTVATMAFTTPTSMTPPDVGFYAVGDEYAGTNYYEEITASEFSWSYIANQIFPIYTIYYGVKRLCMYGIQNQDNVNSFDVSYYDTV